MSAVGELDRWRGRIIGGRFKILEPLGEGGMAVVYRAQEQGPLRRDVAIKVLTTKSSLSSVTLARFRNEAHMMAQIQHPNIVDILDAGDDDGHPFLAMQLLSGRTLQDVINSIAAQGERFSWDAVASIAIQICSALAAAHRQGIVHRDIKPSNCFCIDHDGDHPFIKVLDFGISKARVDTAPEDTMPTPLTQEGMFLGTPHYAAPETYVNRPEWPIDGRADIFAVGVIMYQMLTGRLPFQGEPQIGVLLKVAHDRPPTPRERDPHLPISENVDSIVMTAMSIDPRERFETATALATAIRASLREPKPAVSPAADSGQRGVLVKGSITDFRPVKPEQPAQVVARPDDKPRQERVRPSVIIRTRSTDETPRPPGVPAPSFVPPTVIEPSRARNPVALRTMLLVFLALLVCLAGGVALLIRDSWNRSPSTKSGAPRQ